MKSYRLFELPVMVCFFIESKARLVLWLDSTLMKMLLMILSNALIIFYIPESEVLTKVLLFLIKPFNRSILERCSEPTADPSNDFFLSFISYFLSR